MPTTTLSRWHRSVTRCSTEVPSSSAPSAIHASSGQSNLSSARTATSSPTLPGGSHRATTNTWGGSGTSTPGHTSLETPTFHGTNASPTRSLPLRLIFSCGTARLRRVRRLLYRGAIPRDGLHHSTDWPMAIWSGMAAGQYPSSPKRAMLRSSSPTSGTRDCRRPATILDGCSSNAITGVVTLPSASDQPRRCTISARKRYGEQGRPDNRHWSDTTRRVSTTAEPAHGAPACGTFAALVNSWPRVLRPCSPPPTAKEHRSACLGGPRDLSSPERHPTR